MNLTEIQNNILLVVNPMQGKPLSPKQQHAKDTLTACFNAIGKLSDVVVNKDEQLEINYREVIKLQLENTKLKRQGFDMEKELESLRNELKEVYEQNEELKKNLTL